jgi:hypothetical protein
MRRCRVARSLSAAAFCAAAHLHLAGCGDDEGNAVNRPRDAGTSDGAFDEASVSFPDAAAADSGVFSTVDVADTPCSARGGSTKEVYAADATTFRPQRLLAVGARRAVLVADGFVLMDADGSNASPALVASPFAITSLASTSANLFGVGGASQNLQTVRFDATGAAQPPLDVAPTSSGSGAGGGAGTALLAWVEGSSLRAAAFKDDGSPAAPPFYFRQNLAENETSAFDVVHAQGEEYGVAFVGQRAGAYRLVFTRVSTSARVGISFTILSGNTPLRLIQIAHAGTGFALLVERRPTTGPRETLVIRLDDAGKLAGPALRLLGVRSAFGIASSGGELGVLAWRVRGGPDAGPPDEPEPDAIEFRPFDAAGTALGPWVCVDAPFIAPTVDVGAAILGEDTGYSVIVRTPSHAVSLARFDRRGTGG